jgi:hypothetical protein
MKHSDFYIGLEFLAGAGFRWRCTDVGPRTILAIQLGRKDPLWYQGPPYIAKEVVFDEHDLEECHLTWIDAVAAAVDGLNNSGHPGFPNDVVTHMLTALERDSAVRYPNAGVLRFDRCGSDGEILHPYAGRRAGGDWVIELYLPFLKTYSEMVEHDFIALPIATAQDIRARADRQ